MEFFPAIVIGGPPHSGKSVLAYNLSVALRKKDVEHYLLRACPDGEGDWSNQMDQSRVRMIRLKGNWTPTWVEQIVNDISHRHFPLLVDVGGEPQPWQEPVLSHCTHTVLLTTNEDSLASWRDLAQRNGLVILAEIVSSLVGAPEIQSEHPFFKATLTGLERGNTLQNPVFAALVDSLTPYLHYPETELRNLHLNSSPVENTIDLARFAAVLNIQPRGQQPLWEPSHLPAVLDYLPTETPLALYGRAPNWLYAAIALQTYPAAFYQFDPRLGWVMPPLLKLGVPDPKNVLQIEVVNQNEITRFRFKITDSYLDYSEANQLIVPVPPQNRPIILDGKIPHWLITALATTYCHVPLLAVYQPQIGNVVIHSQLSKYQVGALLEH